MTLSAKSRLILALIKVERAKEHFVQFENLAKSFEGATCQIVVSSEDFSLSPFQFSGALPDIREYPVASFRLLAVAGDIINNLRSSLDHLAYQLVEVGSGKTPSDCVAFPIVRDAKDYESAKARKVRGMRPRAVRAIDALKPYKGGNDPLWRLHEFNNIDKHRFVFKVFCNGLFLGEGFDGHYWLQATTPQFAGISPPKMDEKDNFSVREPLSEVEIGNSKSLLEFLRESLDLVESIVKSFEPHLE